MSELNVYKIFDMRLNVLCVVSAECADEAFAKARLAYGCKAVGLQRI